MNVIFRVDASIHIGSGHLMRCLTLAGIMRGLGAEALFLCRDLPGNLCHLVMERGFKERRLPRPEEHDLWDKVDVQADADETMAVLMAEKENSRSVDLLVIDHYALNAAWEQKMRPWAGRIMVIDDLADRRHDCDILLDQNYYDNLEIRYDNLLPEHCIRLLGPGYVLLEPEFHRQKQRLRKRDGAVRRILVFFGSSDPSNETGKALRAIQLLGKKDLAVDVVVGSGNPHLDQIRHACSSLPGIRFHCQINNMAELVADADFAIGAGGTSMWERCYLGLPSMVIIVADNQMEPVQAAAKAGAVINVGVKENLQAEELAQHIDKLISMPGLLKDMSSNALSLMDSRVGSEAILLDLLMGNGYAKA